MDTADEVCFTYSITNNESSSVFFPIDIARQLKLMLWSEAKLEAGVFFVYIRRTR